MKRFISLFSILFFSFNSFSQKELKWYNPYPDGISINSVWFVDEDHAWAVGDFGKILFWNGHNWSRQESKTNETLNSVYFTDPYHGWAVGNNGCTLRFENNAWTDQSIGQNVALRCVVIPGEDDGWICGDTILRLQNKEWKIYPGQDTLSINLMSFTSVNDGWAVNNSQRIYHFNGESWSEKSSLESGGNFYNLSFSDPEHGILCSMEMDGTVIYNYTNNTLLPAILSTNIYSIYMIDSATGYAVGNGGWFYMGDRRGYIYKYENSLWSLDTIVETPLQSVHGNGDLVWAAGASGNIYLKRNKSWQLINGYTDQSIISISFPDSVHGWMASPKGYIFKYDQGRFELDTVFPELSILGLDFTNTQTGFALANKNTGGYNFRFLKFKNHKWESNTVLSNDYPVALAVFDEANIWVACSRSLMFYNGFFWQKYNTSLAVPQHLKGMCVVNSLVGFAVGYNTFETSFLMKFDGIDWIIINQDLPPFIYRVGAFNDQCCWMTDSYGKIWKYDLLSESITEEVPQQSTIFEAGVIQMISDTEGYISNLNGIMRYDGSSWAYLDEKKLYTPLSFDFTHKNYKWVGGYHGLLLSDYALSPLSDSKQPKPEYFNAKAYPNPVTEATVVEYENIGGECVKVEIADSFGRLIFTYTVVDQQTGTNKLVLPQPLPSPGIYFCRIIIGTKIEIVKLVKY